MSHWLPVSSPLIWQRAAVQILDYTRCWLRTHSFGAVQRQALFLSLSAVQNKAYIQYPDEILVIWKLLDYKVQ
jgi:hypothetical protein